MEKLKRRIPVIPLRGLTVLPTMVLHFDVSRDKSIRAIEAAMENDQMLFLTAQRDPEENNPGITGVYEIGMNTKIRNVQKLPKDLVRVTAEGMQKARLLEMEEQDGFLLAKVELIEEQVPELNAISKEAMVRALWELLKRYAQLNHKFSKDMLRQLLEIRELEKLTMAVSVQLPLYYTERQELLEADGLVERYNVLSALMVKEMEVLQIRNDIQMKVKERVDKHQKEYLLREQLKDYR